MNLLAAILYLHWVIMVQSDGPYFLSTSNFIQKGHVSETPDVCVLAIQPLVMKSLVECALYCGMNSFCIAFDYCSLNGFHTCRFRYGHATLSTTITQCELYEITAVSTILTLIFLNLNKDDTELVILFLPILFLNANMFGYVLIYKLVP